MSDSVLIVEDTASTGILYQSWLKKAGISGRCVEDGASAMAELRNGGYRLVLLDLQLPDVNGLEILSAIQEEDISVAVIVVTSSGSLNTAVDVMRAGAYDFIVKPVAEERLVTTVNNALEHKILETAAQEIKETSGKSQRFGFIGSSLPMLAVYNTIKAVARSNASVFITGESGTGKELCAEALHKNGPRRSKPFVPLNCAAIPDNLIESELFGHVKGAFTGATSDREGAAASADGGTLFLDELCEMDLALQSKLLRFLQTGQVQKVGSDRAKKVDVRVVCATNREPLREVAEGRLREDLYYRLHVVGIHLPPLRERNGDIIEIAAQFLKSASKEEGKSFERLSADAMDALLSHDWPGNVRELQNVIRKAAILNDGSEVTADMLGMSAAAPQLRARTGRPADVGARPDLGSDIGSIEISLDQPFAAMERMLIEATIAECNGSIPRAADLLKLSPSTIYRKKEGWD